MWLLEPFGCFSLKSAVNIFQPNHASLIFWELLWDSINPIKYSIFMWKLFNEFLAVDSIEQKLGFHLASQMSLQEWNG